MNQNEIDKFKAINNILQLLNSLNMKYEVKQLCELMMDRITELIEKGIDPVELINLLPGT